LTLKRHNARAFGICIARRLICRQVLPRAKSDFAQFDLRVNVFTVLLGGSGGCSDILRKDNPENSRSNPQARGGSAVAHSGK
jgi:hypothetical protein